MSLMVVPRPAHGVAALTRAFPLYAVPAQEVAMFPVSIQLVSDLAQILEMQTSLSKLSERCGQVGAMDDLAYYLRRPGAQKKIPHLLLFFAKDAPHVVREPALVGAMLLYEFCVLSFTSGIYAIDDTTGRRTLVALHGQHEAFAVQAASYLLKRGAHLVAISYQRLSEAVAPPLEAEMEGAAEPVKQEPSRALTFLSKFHKSWRISLQDREIESYLPFEATFDQTMARIGKRTRNHLRYYRKRAEKDLACSFLPVAVLTMEDFLELNASGGAFRITDEMVRYRYESLQRLQTPVLMGLRDADGRWLSVLGGRRFGENDLEVYWQMNRADLPAYSLSTVLRAYLIEHEVACGTRRMYMEGGTTHSLSHSFSKSMPTDLLARRRTLRTSLFRKMAKNLMAESNFLPSMLARPAECWHRGRA